MKTLQTDVLPNASGNPLNLERCSYAWLGHSLGCRLVQLLELLSTDPDKLQSLLEEAQSPDEWNRVKIIIQSANAKAKQNALKVSSERQIDSKHIQLDASEKKTQDKESNSKQSNELAQIANQANPSFIHNQPPILMAPQLSGAQRIRPTSLELSNSALKPSWEQAYFLLRSASSVFGITEIIQFDQDEIARNDVLFITDVLEKRKAVGKDSSKDLQISMLTKLPGNHFAPLSPTPELVAQIETKVVSLRKRVKIP